MHRIQEFNHSCTKNYNLSVSLGLASFDPRNPVSIEELLVRADQAMYMDKRSHKDWTRKH
ncbi:MAG TPA: diguanylate cyclase, partial [Fibrobacteraceae bacterium]|nr:diguanylate cyclase [Fibrobacteraceae bacterium]